MRSFLLIIFFFGFVANMFAQNPHGADLKINCASCHSPTAWKIEASYWQNFDPQKPRISQTTGMPLGIDTLRFHHSKTNFELKGRHQTVDCRSCHETLVFSEAKSDCNACHNDVHQQSVGLDCARCHTPANWLVDNVTDLHQSNGFPLTGVHKTADCAQCHSATNPLQFNRIGNDCVSCHTKDYQASTNPNHQQAGFSTNCIECHDVFTPDWTTNEVKHDFFPLNKGHDVTDCNKCHTGGNYANTPNTCNACHQADYTATQAPSHVTAQFPNDCAQCHTTDPDWTPAQFTMHDGSYFPIYSGKHKGQWAQCVDCHDNATNYTSFTCTNCHLNPETDNGHAGVNGYVYENTACLACHPTGDAGTVFDHNNTSFPLTGAHLSANCLDCHAGGYVGTPTQCAACHTTDYNQSLNPKHEALNIPTDCAQCHTTAPGWAPATFPIHNNYYVLNGAHAAIANDCATCHNGNYNNTPNTCNGCHNADYTATTNPNHPAQQFPTDCATCHSETAWTPSTFNHNTVYPFVGAHIQIADDCNACHQGNYTNTPNTCNGCHNADYTATANPNHVTAQFPTDCATCHTQTAWTPSTFDHNTYYPFTGAHTAIANDCNACHQGNYTNTPNTCNGCHTTDYNQSVNPNHTALNIPTDCAQCHTTAPGWAPATFPIHNNYYALNGAHAAIANDCASCHNGNYNNTPNTCNGCHNADYAATTNPNHSAQQFPTDCATCHSETAWTPSTFNHNTVYPFVGAHIQIADDCNACHQGNYTNTPNTCNGCHNADYTATTNPNHVASQFPTDCATCHTQTAWTPSTFDHNTYYPFTGAHTAIADDCNACHQGNYTNTPNTCNGCHTTDYNQSVNPNHTALNIPTDCAQCHTTAPGWAPATFSIHNNYYTLNGAHAAIANDCATCHNGNYNNTPNTCNGCHNADYNAVTAPNHVAQQFPTDCATCHSETAWAPSTFNHNTVYPFSGAHIPIADDCNACHQGNYTNTPNTCAGCHTTDYNQSTNPNHTALNIPTDCAMCHTTAPGWEPATFPIHNNYYGLNGAHALISNDCATCHNGNYTTTPNTCAGCHTNDYNQTNNPNHAALQFSNECATCHTETAWTPSTFDHDVQYFPIFSGKHNGEWSACTDCHTNPANYAEFTCITCHTNTETNNQHNGVNGYVYNSSACLACHPTGDGNVIFDHNTTAFPLTGAHLTAECLDCHASSFAGTPTQCSACHTTDYNQSANPSHTALNIPTDCATCHTTAPGWAPASFPTHNSYYGLNGAHAAIANDCAACHNGNYTNTPNTCNACHSNDYNTANDPNHVAQQFPTDCATCHSETAWAPSTFNHSTIYAFTGAHIAIANDCNACHHGNYTNTPNTCAGCHTPDFNQSANPNHVALNIPTDCAMCHTTAPGWEPATFPIHNNYYTLNGAHIAIANDCATCHNGNYTNTPNTCAGCHQDNYNQTTNPNHTSLQFSTDCASCHTEGAWVPSTFNHDAQYFPIYSGSHNGEWNMCTDCHINPANYAEFTCTTCHTNPETNNQHNGVNGYSYNSPACLACHPTGSGTNIFNHNTTSFPLTGAHLTADCLDCHASGFAGTPTQCSACHTTDFNASANPNHVALNLPTDCAMCHTTAPGWEPATFPIHNNFYALNGAHAAIANDCATCHNGNYNNTPNTCNGCHNDDYTQTTNPNHATSQFPTDCAACHSETAWTPSTFDHNAIYPFTGAHITIANDCNTCHNGNYTNTPNTCAGCHTPNYNSSTNPNHVALNLPTDCAMCHTTAPGWEPATFPIHNNYYALNGAHAAIANDCATCHNGNYNNTPNTCNGCHNDDYTQTTNPNHATSQFPTDCAACHSETAWAPSTFDHNTIYPFTGAHTTIANDCNACHNGNYNNTPNTCAGCHTPNYNSSTNPNHVALNLPTDCAMCHTTAPGWEPATFPIHNNFYALNGAHAAIANDCATCHNGNYNNTPNTCNGCHNDDYTQTTNPNHAAAQFPTDCALCHAETAWVPATFDHNTIYPFTGAHIPIANDCNACHNGNYTNTPNTCAGCHTPNYNSSTNPNHVTLALPTDCAMCHTTDPGWEPATFPIHNNYWAITGAHTAIANDCIACHNGNYNNTPNTCNGCHNDDYTQTNNPNHATQQFPTDCTVCHSQTAWVPSTFDHNAVFPFTGAHIPIANDCNACHNGNYTNTPNTCSGCHTPDYNTSTNPNHLTLALPTDCAMCHTTDPNWDPATFPIHNNFWPLTGAHAAIANDCAACHNGNYNNTPTTCNGCHNDDYLQTTNPNHTTQQFPTDCTICHSQTAWVPSTFDHNAVFPFTGAHIPIANDCNECHNGNYTNTPNTCAGCHTPAYNTSTNPNHITLSLPTDCAMCHTTDPNWEPATFPIHNNYWTLSGAHAAIANDCAACHNGNYNNTPNTCYGCHASDYSGANNPNHSSAGFPTTCQNCHNQSAWTPSTFNHDQQYFPIYSGKHDNEWNQCSECHTNPNNYTVFNCILCHEHDDPANMADHHQGVSGYQYLSSACYACHPNGQAD